MNCPHCGAPVSGAGMFCMRCGARLTPQETKPAQAAVPDAARANLAPTAYQPTPIGPAGQGTFVRARDSVATIRHISAGSVFKVVFVTYLLLLGLLGLLVVVLPGLLGASLLGALVDDRYNEGAFGGGIMITLITYVAVVVGGAIGPAIVAALSALIYNVVAGWVGGVRIRLQE